MLHIMLNIYRSIRTKYLSHHLHGEMLVNGLHCFLGKQWETAGTPALGTGNKKVN